MEDIEEEKKEQENTEEVKPKNKKTIKKVLIIIGILIVLAIVGMFAYAIVAPIMREDTTAYKPIIYLYPEKTTEVTVKLGSPGKIICSYPKYTNGWNVIANPDGTLVDTNTGRKLYSLYWEGLDDNKYDLEEGFVVKGDEVIEFLEEKLGILGLNEFEAEEFIVYWLPKLESNKYNYIRFATMEEINKNMPLEFSVEPDTIIRVLMQYKRLDEPIEVKEQELVTPERNGFVAVEWGGSELEY